MKRKRREAGGERVGKTWCSSSQIQKKNETAAGQAEESIDVEHVQDAVVRAARARFQNARATVVVVAAALADERRLRDTTLQRQAEGNHTEHELQGPNG